VEFWILVQAATCIHLIGELYQINSSTSSTTLIEITNLKTTTLIYKLFYEIYNEKLAREYDITFFKESHTAK
jgi:hypothetical protein